MKSTRPNYSGTGGLLLFSLCLLCGGARVHGGATPEPLILAEQESARLDIVLGPEASEPVRETADELARQLGRISGAAFRVVTGDGRTGLAVGTYRDFPDISLDLPRPFDPREPVRREEYLLRTHADGVWVIGATPAAVKHATWDLLYELGFRQFFPGPAWEIVPQMERPVLAVDRFESPDFIQRTLGVGHGLRSQRRQPHGEWRRRNRFKSAIAIRSGHTYGSIIRANRKAFEEHPEYLALVDGERRGRKFCISNPGLRDLVVEHAKNVFHENPERESISMEPSDGGNWCECAACAEMGSVSDRVVILANAVAEAINSLGYGTKYVGLLAYHMHSPPPHVRIHSRVVVRAATNGARGGYTHQEIIEGWQAQGATTGVSDFYSVFVWDSSMPARQKASDLVYIRESLQRFRRTGARHFNVAISDNWGAAGLGSYITARILWDIREADRIEMLFDDFLIRAFGPAREPMERFFRLTHRIDENDRRPLMRGDMIARMYRSLAEARELTEDPAIQRRLDDLVVFTRYAELFDNYKHAQGRERQDAIVEVLRHAWRIRDTGMVHTRAILGHLARRDSGVEEVSDETVQVGEAYTAEEIKEMLLAGMENTDVVELDFKPVAFSRDLVPSTPLNLPEVPQGRFGNVPMGRHEYFTWVDTPGEVRLRASGGHIEHYRHLAGPARIALYAAENPVEEPQDVDEERVLPDGETHEIRLRTEYARLHRAEAVQASNRVHIEPAEPGIPWTAEISLERHNRFSSLWTLYVYVPRGTRVVGGFATSQSGSLRDGDGNIVLNFSDIETPGYFRAEVPEGQDGTLWQLHRVSGRRRMMTIPPFAARCGEELLLPREVVETEAP